LFSFSYFVWLKSEKPAIDLAIAGLKIIIFSLKFSTHGAPMTRDACPNGMGASGLRLHHQFDKYGLHR
jgi:hypothetical protein